MSGEENERPSITRSNMNQNGFDPADPAEDELRSGNRLRSANLYRRLVEEGYEEAAEEVRRAGSVQQQLAIASRHCREHGLESSR